MYHMTIQPQVCNSITNHSRSWGVWSQTGGLKKAILLSSRIALLHFPRVLIGIKDFNWKCNQ